MQESNEGRILFAVGIIAASSGCGDPVRSDRIDALGPEQPGVEQGPFHRPGQPCVLCHSSGGEDPHMSVAGTVFQRPDSEAPLGGAVVEMEDDRGDTWAVVTNCAGNFYVTEKRWRPEFPLTVSVRYGSEVVEMESLVRRDGSCAGCHEPSKGPSSPGRVYFTEEPTTFPRVPCVD